MADHALPRIWALLGARAGDNDQVIALAEALGFAFTVKQLDYRRLHVLGPRLLGSSLASLNRASRAAILEGAPPDLTISTGHRSVPVVRALRQRSAGRTGSIHIGFPRVSPAHFDLVITTPQYPIADDPRLLRIPYALTRAATGNVDGRSPSDLADLPSPRRLLIVGGPTLYWELDRRALLRALEELLEEARTRGGSVLVSTSPRTPAAIREELAAAMRNTGVATLLAEPGQEPDYASLLSAADCFHVTADSVSMISDAIWSGKPLALVPISMSVSGRAMFGLHDLLRPGSRAYPQDLRFFWRALEEIGIGERLAIPHTATSEIKSLLMGRAHAVLASRRSVLTR